MERNFQVKRKRDESDVAPAPSKKTKGECNRPGLYDLRDRKKKATNDGPNPSKRGEHAIETPTENREGNSKKRKREAEDGSEAPEKKSKLSHSSSSSSSSSAGSTIIVPSSSPDSFSPSEDRGENFKKRKREAEDGSEAPEKESKLSHISSSCDGSTIIGPSSSPDSFSPSEDRGENFKKRKREAEDGSEAPEKKSKLSHISSSCDGSTIIVPSSSLDSFSPSEDRGENFKKRKREAEDGSEAPEKKSKLSHISSSCDGSTIIVPSSSPDSFSPSEDREENFKKRKREAEDGSEAPEKKSKLSHSSSSCDGSTIIVPSSSPDSFSPSEDRGENFKKRKREAEDGSEAPEKESKLSHISSSCDGSTIIGPSSSPDSFSPSEDRGENFKKRKREAEDGSEAPEKKSKLSHISSSCDGSTIIVPSSSLDSFSPSEDRGENFKKRKREAEDGSEAPEKKSKLSHISSSCDGSTIIVPSSSPDSFSPSEDREENFKKRKREAEDGSEAPEKKSKLSHSSSSCDGSTIIVPSSSPDSFSPSEDRGENFKKRKREAEDGSEAPEKKSKLSHISSRCDGSTTIVPSSSPDSFSPSEDREEDFRKRKREAQDGSEAPEKKSKLSHSSSSRNCGPAAVSGSFLEIFSCANDDIIYHDLGRVSDEEEKIYRMSSSAKTSKADFQKKYLQMFPLGCGGFGTVYSGFREPDILPVAIKHIAREKVELEQVECNGKVYTVIMEIAFLLKAGGLPGTVGQSAGVSLLDWYVFDNELILVMEKPHASMDLEKYLNARRGPLSEKEAMNIFKQLVDAAIYMHSKGVFHSDIKPENVLIQQDPDEIRVRIIDFGCGSLLKEEPYDYFSGTPDYAPPEWFLTGLYRAGPFIVWQLGVVLFSMLRGNVDFSTSAFLFGTIGLNIQLSQDCRSLLEMCLVTNPDWRATLEQLQGHSAFK